MTFDLVKPSSHATLLLLELWESGNPAASTGLPSAASFPQLSAFPKPVANAAGVRQPFPAQRLAKPPIRTVFPIRI